MSRLLQTFLVRGWHKLAYWFRRAQLDSELAEELEFHRSLIENDHRGAGLPRQAALQLSRRQMGNFTIAKEDCRDMWGFAGLEKMTQDFRYGLRIFRRTPGFTLIAVLSLAVGIGGNAAIFCLVEKLLVRPLPYREPERLVRISGIYPRAALPVFQQQSLTMDVAAVSAGSELNLTSQGEAMRIFASGVSANFFSVLGAPVAVGRSFAPGEDLPGRDRVVILSNSLWKRKFNGDPAILGHMITLDDVNREVIGVMPAGFSFPSGRVEVWLPLRLDASNFVEYWGTEFVPCVARLRPGVTLGQAGGEIQALVGRFRDMFPYPMARDWNANATAIPLQQDIMGDVSSRLMILLASVGIVLLIACANVASLLLSRATARRKEIALRIALGADRLRIVRQVLTESVLLALIGGGTGILLGMSALSIFKSLLPPSTPGLTQASIDGTVVGSAIALSLLTGVAFGIAPALSAAQTDFADSIKAGSQRSVAPGWSRIRSWLIGLEIASTVVLVASAGLLARSLYILSEAQPGFQPEGIVTIRISPNQSSCVQREACIALYQNLLQHTRDIPGIAEAEIASAVPLDGQLSTVPVDVEDHPKSAGHPAPMFWAGAISPGYISLMHIPVLAGRSFTDADGDKASGVLLITHSTARRFWPGQDAVGKHIKLAGEQQWRTVVGIVGDVRQYSLSKALPDGVPGAMYMPYAQSANEDHHIPVPMTLLVRGRTSSDRLAGDIRSVARAQNPNVPVGEVQTLAEIVAASVANFRSTIRVFVSFAGTAVLLAAIGIYGMVSYWVVQRTYEIGVRVAIGATRQRIVSMILTQGLRTALYGILTGVVAAVAFTRLLSGLLYGVGANDPVTFAAVISFLFGVAVVAAAFPAWKAARIDPVKSLKADL